MDTVNSTLRTKDWMLNNPSRSYATLESSVRTRIQLGEGRILGPVYGNSVNNFKALNKSSYSAHSDMDLKSLKSFRLDRLLKRRAFQGGHVAARASLDKGMKKAAAEEANTEVKRLGNDALKLERPDSELKSSVNGQKLEPGRESQLTAKENDGKQEHMDYSQWPPWKRLPQRYKLIGATSLAFVICNMDKVNLSVAIIPMSHQLGWNASTAGIVQSSFFWGYALSQLPGGWLAKQFTGRKVLEFGVLAWSMATALVPITAGYMPGLIISRILVGIGEGVSPSAATDLIARQAHIV